MRAGRSRRSGGASSGYRGRKGKMMDKIENTVSIHNFINKLSRKEKDTYLICKLSELVEGYNGLVTSWNEIYKIVKEKNATKAD